MHTAPLTTSRPAFCSPPARCTAPHPSELQRLPVALAPPLGPPVTCLAAHLTAAHLLHCPHSSPGHCSCPRWPLSPALPYRLPQLFPPPLLPHTLGYPPSTVQAWSFAALPLGGILGRPTVLRPRAAGRAWSTAVPGPGPQCPCHSISGALSPAPGSWLLSILSLHPSASPTVTAALPLGLKAGDPCTDPLPFCIWGPMPLSLETTSDLPP